MFILLIGVRAVAQDATFTAQAPQAVVLGERFRITYKVDTRDAKEFRAPDMKSINILSGPNTSTSSSTSIYNGQVTSTYTLTYTYVAVATEEGDVSLDGATIKANGKQLTSNKLTSRPVKRISSHIKIGTAKLSALSRTAGTRT